MKHIRRFKDIVSEAVIDWETPELREFIDVLKDRFEKKTHITLNELADIAESFDIEVVDYEKFYSELPESLKPTAPGGGRGVPIPFFALINPITNKIRIVLNQSLSRGSLEHFIGVLKHEITHIGQLNRSGGKLGGSYNPINKKEYFSHKGEMMAFAQIIVHDIMLNPRITNIAGAMSEIKSHPIWRSEIQYLDDKEKNRYKKYIYSYFELEFNKRNKPKN
jgi:hypothetical protein